MATSNDPAGAATQPSQPHYLDTHAFVRPNKVALICGERSLTYAEFNARARRVANTLSGLGVKANDRVAVMAYNSIELLEIVAGLSKLSAIGVLLNYRLREHEVAYIIHDCQAKVALAGPGLVEVVDKARAEIEGDVVFVAIGDEVEYPSGWDRAEESLTPKLALADPSMRTS